MFNKKIKQDILRVQEENAFLREELNTLSKRLDKSLLLLEGRRNKGLYSFQANFLEALEEILKYAAKDLGDEGTDPRFVSANDYYICFAYTTPQRNTDLHCITWEQLADEQD